MLPSRERFDAEIPLQHPHRLHRTDLDKADGDAFLAATQDGVAERASVSNRPPTVQPNIFFAVSIFCVCPAEMAKQRAVLGLPVVEQVPARVAAPAAIAEVEEVQLDDLQRDSFDLLGVMSSSPLTVGTVG